MEKNVSKQDLIKHFKLTEQELAHLDLVYGDYWVKHSDPAMYVGAAREALAGYHCPECGRRISARDYEDYRMCERCHERLYND